MPVFTRDTLTEQMGLTRRLCQWPNHRRIGVVFTSTNRPL